MITPEQMEEFRALAAPVVKFINEQLTPHHEAHISSTGANIIEDSAYIPINEYIQD